MTFRLLLLSCFALFLISCGSGSSTPAPTPAPTPVPTPTPAPSSTIMAMVTKAPVDGAACDLIAPPSTVVASATSAMGVAMFSNVSQTGTFIVSCTGGTYTDEATGLAVTDTAALTLRSVTTVMAMGATVSAVVSPLTEIAVAASMADLSDFATQAMVVANDFGLSGVDIASTIPTDTNQEAPADDSAGDYGLVLAGISQAVATNQGNSSTVEALNILISDANDNAAAVATSVSEGITELASSTLSASAMNITTTETGFITIPTPIPTPAPAPVATLDLPVDFESTTLSFDLVDFGNAASIITVDPNDSNNMVASTIKNVGAETFAGTTVAGPRVGFVTAIPFSSTQTVMSVEVLSPVAGIPVRLKVEDSSDPTISVETEAMVTTANTWETLFFDFSDEASGTAELNLASTYNLASIFFDFGATGNGNTYLWDNVVFAGTSPDVESTPVATFGVFGGVTIDADTGAFNFPAAAESFGGFANTNESLYPLAFANGGTVTFTAALPSGGSDTNVRFVFEANPFPNNTPNFSTENVLVNSETETVYSVAIPAQATEQEFNSFLLFLVERDSPVIITNVQVLGSSADDGDDSDEDSEPSDLAAFGVFGGVTIDADTGAFNFPTSAESFGGFANTNESLYPLAFANGGTVTFTAALPSGGSDTNVRFLFEANPFPDTEPNFSTENVLVNSENETVYSVAIPAQAAEQAFNSFILFLVERDSPVIITNVQIIGSSADNSDDFEDDSEPSSSTATFGVFGGVTIDADTGAFNFPASAESFGGFANTNESLYPLVFANGGTVTFTAALPSGGSDTNVRFLFEANPFPDTEPNFSTENVLVNSENETVYSVAIPAQDAGQDFNSFILFLVERDSPVIITNVVVTTN